MVDECSKINPIKSKLARSVLRLVTANPRQYSGGLEETVPTECQLRLLLFTTSVFQC